MKPMRMHTRTCAHILTHAHALPGVNAHWDSCENGLNIYFEAPGLRLIIMKFGHRDGSAKVWYIHLCQPQLTSQ
jgi:hypothetical protein